MKYTVHGFSQREAVKLKLDNDDLLLLRWMVDFSGTGKMKHYIIKNKIYYWINYQTVCDDLPILATKKDTLYRRMKKLCNSKVLKHETLKENGTYSLYGFGIAFESLVSDDLEEGYGKKSVGGTEKNPEGVRKKIPNKDLSIINLSTRETHTEYSKNSQNIKTLCVEVQKILGEKVSEKKLQELINSKGVDAVQQYLTNWDKYRHHANSTQASYFIYAVQNELPEPQAKKSNTYKPILDQREYREEDLEKFYVNVMAD